MAAANGTARAGRPSCVQCGQLVTRKRRGSDALKFCSRECTFAHWSANGRPRERQRAPFCKVYFGNCAACGKGFCSGQSTTRYCSPRCSAKGQWLARSHRDYSERKCAGCGLTFAPVYGDKRRRFCSQDCAVRADRRGRAKNHQARAKRAGVERRYFNERRIFERDKWTCRLCGCKTPRSLKGTDRPNAPELDHVVPISRGGAHVPENVQCACRQCNAAKGARPMGQLWLAGMADTR